MWRPILALLSTAPTPVLPDLLPKSLISSNLLLDIGFSLHQFKGLFTRKINFRRTQNIGYLLSFIQLSKLKLLRFIEVLR